jgi:hypothetical protein
MESIIHIFIYSKIFLEEFLKIKNNNRKSLTYLFNNFIKEIAKATLLNNDENNKEENKENENNFKDKLNAFNKIEIFNFSKEYK